MSETSDFGGWRKRRGQQVYEPKEGHPYQQKLVGDRTVPKDSPPDDDEPDHPPATEPHPELEQDPDPPAVTAEQLPPAGQPLLWRTRKGEHGVQHCCGGEAEGYIVFRDPGRGKLRRVRYYNVPLGIERVFGAYTTVSKAMDDAMRDNDTRLRFPGDVASGLLLDDKARYQIVETKGVGVGLGTDRGTGPVRKWRAERVGGQDEQNTDLGEHDELAEAIAACQADADQRRAEG